MRFALVTGTSRGLGESLASFLLESGVHVIGVSRSDNPILQDKAISSNQHYTHIKTDLTQANEVEDMIEEAKKLLSGFDVSTLYIINNAGILEPMNQAKKIDSSQLIKHFQINTITPMMIINAFLKENDTADYQIVAVNITSGAATKAIYGWSAYSSAKASINAYTRTLAKEQEELKTHNKIFAFSPGVMDTDMQKHIRKQDKEAFIEVENFKNYKLSNLLKDTDVVGGILIDILTNESAIENGKIYEVTDYL